ncbi:hypothetical protein [Burkholderia sp. LMG 21824]|uniref:hypothetical protein n=1 Tax=Burkholderia sp. LMG 21824 TaxID=3158172 RepID=UPI003C2CA0E4
MSGKAPNGYVKPLIDARNQVNGALTHSPSIDFASGAAGGYTAVKVHDLVTGRVTKG